MSTHSPAPADARTVRRRLIPRRAARSAYSADAALWVAWCAHVGARLDAPGRAADAVAWCASGRAATFALPSKLRTLDRAGVDRTLARIQSGEPYPRLRLHVCHVGEGTGRPVVIACDSAGPVGHVGAHHVCWIAALPRHAVDALAVVVTRATGGTDGADGGPYAPSRGFNVALCGIGPALRLAAALPAPALVAAPGGSVVREPAPGYRLGRAWPVVTLGHVVATPGALDLVDAGVDLLALLRRHAAGDWGDGDAGDRRLNTQALDSGGRLLSVYETAAGTLWIITEADRSATTLLRPADY